MSLELHVDSLALSHQRSPMLGIVVIYVKRNYMMENLCKIVLHIISLFRRACKAYSDVFLRVLELPISLHLKLEKEI